MRKWVVGVVIALAVLSVVKVQAQNPDLYVNPKLTVQLDVPWKWPVNSFHATCIRTRADSILECGLEYKLAQASALDLFSLRSNKAAFNTSLFLASLSARGHDVYAIAKKIDESLREVDRL